MKYSVKIYWKKQAAEPFTDNKYSRTHKWIFDGGSELVASSSPKVVPVPMSDTSAVDPEEAFVASLSSCHMLFFLSIAASRNYIIDVYEDYAEGIMGEIKEGEMAMTNVILNPNVVFSASDVPSPERIDEMHQLAHERCFIANSVKTKIDIIST